MIKRGLSCLLVMAVAANLFLVGCGEQQGANGDEGGTVNNNDVQTGETKGEDPYYFESNGVKIYMDGKLSDIEEALGEPKGYFEQPSCAVDGVAKIFTFSGYELETYEIEGVDYVAYVVLMDDTVATPEGVDLSMTKADVLRVYGDEYEESENLMVYKRGSMALRFIFEGDNIISIEYCSELYM